MTLRGTARFGIADDFDPASSHDDADNQPKNQVRKGALSKQHEHATNHCSKVSQSVIFGEHPTGADVHLAVPMLLQESNARQIRTESQQTDCDHEERLWLTAKKEAAEHVARNRQSQ